MFSRRKYAQERYNVSSQGVIMCGLMSECLEEVSVTTHSLSCPMQHIPPHAIFCAVLPLWPTFSANTNT